MHRLLGNNIAVHPSVAQSTALLEWAGEPVRQLFIEVPSIVRAQSSAPVVLGVVLRMMQGHTPIVVPHFRAFVALDVTRIGETAGHFVRQLGSGLASSRKDPWGLAARSWKAFDPTTTAGKLAIKDIKVPLDEMRAVARGAREASRRL